MTNVLVPACRTPGERRVSATPDAVRKFVEAGVQVSVEAGAGVAARYPDEDYEGAGAQVSDDVAGLWSKADVVLTVGPPAHNDDLGGHEADALAENAVIVGFLAPHRNLDAVRTLADRKVTACALELVPRISRAQRMDALSSQANLAGYRAGVTAAYLCDKHFPLSMTAAGTLRPAKVVVLGAGVAGLQAIATARRLGAVVEATDIRLEAKGEVESLGASFIDPPGDNESDPLSAQHRILAERVAKAQAVIATAFVPGKPAPTLLTADAVSGMPEGAVVLDLAAEEGGNCELTRPGEEIDHHGVRVIAANQLASELAPEASQLYARNLLEFVRLILDENGDLRVDVDDDVIRATLVTHAGEILHEPTAASLSKGAQS